MVTCSVFNLLNDFDLFGVIELFLVVLEWLGQGSTLCNRSGPIETLLHRLVHSHASVNQLVFPFVKVMSTGFFGLHLVNKKDLVLLLLTLVPLQIHLLDPLSSVIHFLSGSHALVESSLALGHIHGAILDTLPAFF